MLVWQEFHVINAAKVHNGGQTPLLLFCAGIPGRKRLQGNAISPIDLVASQ